MNEDLRRIFREPLRTGGNKPSPLRPGENQPSRFLHLLELARSRKALALSVAVAAIAITVLSAVVAAHRPASPGRTKATGEKGDKELLAPSTKRPDSPGNGDIYSMTRPPEIEDLGGGRYKGPDGTVVKVPPDWEIAKGDQIELWATLLPKSSNKPIPRIGIGNISAEGLDPADALETVTYYLSEVLPELTSTEEPFRGGILVRGKGTVEGTSLEEVRWIYPLHDRVLVVWGLFPPGYPKAKELVVNSVEPPASPQG